jgi:hypothetical protein
VEAEYKEFDSIFDGSDGSQQQSEDSGAGPDEVKATDSLFDSDDELPVEQLRPVRAASRTPALRTSAYKPKSHNTLADSAGGSETALAFGAAAATPVQPKTRASRARTTVRQPSANEWSTVLSAFDSGSSDNDSDSDSQISL